MNMIGSNFELASISLLFIHQRGRSRWRIDRQFLSGPEFVFIGNWR